LVDLGSIVIGTVTNQNDLLRPRFKDSCIYLLFIWYLQERMGDIQDFGSHFDKLDIG
jgi:hypothetical protein